MPIRIQRESPAAGAWVSGVDLGGDIESSLLQSIQTALLEHHVLFFPEQKLSPEQLLACARRFGEPIVHPMMQSMAGYPGILEIVKNPDDRNNFGGSWHSDLSYLERPAAVSILHAKELPAEGGDTLFANMYLAYESLSQGLKDFLDGLNAVHDTTLIYTPSAQSYLGMLGDEGSMTRLRDDDDHESVLHPVVRIHPETGRKALYVNSNFTSRFEGMSRSESAPLLDFLFEHAGRMEYTCRLRWRPGTLVMWDNRCLQHYALNDYHGARRVMHRVAIEGDRPPLAAV